MALISFITNAQSHFIGFGAQGGFKGIANTGGILIDYNYKNDFTVFAGGANAKFSGAGYCVGFGIHFFNNKTQPSIGMAFNYQSAKSFYAGSDGPDRSDYHVTPSNNLICYLGIRRFVELSFPETDILTVMPYIDYRWNLTNTELILEDGLYREDREIRIRNRINSGFGGGILISYKIRGNTMLRKNNP